MRPVVLKPFLHAVTAATGDAPTSPKLRQPKTGTFDTLGDWELGATLSERKTTVVSDAQTRGTAERRAHYVVKYLRPGIVDDEAVERLRREAASGAAVASPHVVPVLSAHLQTEPFFYVMPKLAGCTLKQLAERRGGRLDVATALCLVRQTAMGLAAVHDAGYVHGDVKPSNIFVSRDGHATLIDLEFLRPLEAEADYAPECLLGTVDYLAPEAACSRNRIDGRSDLYSLGVVLYELLAGRLPFSGATTADVITAHLSAEPPPLREIVSTLPNDVCSLVLKLLHKQALRRPQTAQEAIEQLARLEIAYLHERN